MKKFRIPINSFQFGEVSGSLVMRTDSAVYNSSAQGLENMIVMSEGGVKKRYGLKHIYKYSGITFDPDYPAQSHLFDFSFSNDEQYLISVEHQRIRCFYLEQDETLTLVTDLDVDTNGATLPFHKSYLSQYTVAQYGDVMFICHPLFMPRMLIRTGLTSFEVTPFSFDTRSDNKVTYQPYSEFHGINVTLDPSATSGAGVTFTTSEAYWKPEHVGVIIKYSESEVLITSYVSPTVVVGTIIDTLKIRLSVLNPLRTSDGSSTVEVTHIAHGYSGGESIVISDAAATGGINTGNLNGTRTVAGIIDENTWYFTAGGAASSTEDGGGYVKVTTHAPTTDWIEQSFSAVRGYPAAVVFHENRLCFGGTITESDTIWMSKTGQFFNFNVGDAEDADSINLVAATGKVNEIRYMISNRDLQVFGASGELYVPTYLNQAMTPANAQIRLQTPYGCSFTQPVPFDGATIFVQESGHIVREYLYTDTENAYTSTAISTIASHLITSPKCLSISHGAFGNAESYAFMSNGNGDIALFNSNRAERRAAWTRLTTDGNFCSVCGIDARMFTNVWTADGSLHLCEFSGNIGLDRYIEATAGGYVDVSAVYNAGDTVSVVTADGLQTYGSFTVVDNIGAASINLSGYSGDVCIGVPFTAKITSNPMDAQTQLGSITGTIRGVSSVTIDLKNSVSLRVNGRPSNINQSFTGKKEFFLLGYSKDPKVVIEQDDPLPLQVNGFVAEVVI